MGPDRFRANLTLGMALLALILTVTGVYATVASQVGMRRKEMGIRLALGAAPRRVRAGVVGRALRVGLLGVGLGVAVASVVGRPLESFLFGVDAFDPHTLGAVGLLCLAVVAAAASQPALRAGRVDPKTALMEE